MAGTVLHRVSLTAWTHGIKLFHATTAALALGTFVIHTPARKR